MFVKKARWIFLFFVPIACSQDPAPNETKKQDIKLPGKDWIQEEINKYDSLYQLYEIAGRRTPAANLLLQQSHAYLDSVLEYEKIIIKTGDSTLRKLLLKAMYYKGTDLCDIDRFSEAEILLNKYLVICLEMHLPASPQSAYVHKTIADIYTRLGDDLKAIFHKQQSFQYYMAAKDYGNLASETINISIALREKHLYDSAISYLIKGSLLPAVKTNRLLTMYTELAKNYLAKNDTLSASLTLQKGYAYFMLLKHSKADLNKYEEKNLDRLADYNSTVAALHMQQQKPGAALPLLYEALAFYHTQYGDIKKREIGKTYIELGKACEILHFKNPAIHCFNMALWSVANIDTNNIFALPKKDQVYAENTIIEALEQKAHWMFTYAGAGNKKQYSECAVNCYDIIMDAEYKLLQYFSYDDSKLLMLKESRTRSENAIAACYSLYTTDKNNKWIERAFRFAEQNKSYILLESLKRNLASQPLSQTDSTYRELQQAQINYASREKDLIEAKINHDTALLYKAGSSLDSADKLLQILKSRARYSGNEYNTLVEKQDSVSALAAIKLLPGTAAALLEYFIGDSSSYCFYITADKNNAMYKLSDSLPQLVNAFLTFFATKNDIISNPRGYNNAAYQLYAHLMLPETDQSVRKLIIIADDRLNLVPFDALVTLPVNSFDLSLFRYLIRRFEISYGYSASTLLKQRTNKINNADIAVFTPVFTQHQRGLSTLPFSPKETKSIKDFFRHGQYFENSAATLLQFKTKAPAAGIIHIATHASAAGTPRIEFYDSTLYLGELYAMQLTANLVVLSGCETGIGKIEKAEGVISLARGFYYAGAHNVITSLWNVDDNSTAVLFGKFYSLVQNGNYSHALRKSKLDYLSSKINNDKYSPYYWAGFVCIGASNKAIKTSVYPRLILLFAAAFAVLFILKSFLKKAS